MDTNAQETAKRDEALKQSIQRIDKLVLVSKAAWYKEASGVVAVLSWLILIGIWTWSMITDTQIDAWYLVVVTIIAVIASLFRSTSSRTEVDRYDL